MLRALARGSLRKQPSLSQTSEVCGSRAAHSRAHHHPFPAHLPTRASLRSTLGTLASPSDSCAVQQRDGTGAARGLTVCLGRCLASQGSSHARWACQEMKTPSSTPYA